MTNYYQLLGLSRDASDIEIKKLCNKKLAIYHPDKLVNYLSQFSPNERDAQEIIFKQKYELLSNIIEIFRNPEKRKQYDLHLDNKEEQHQKFKRNFNETCDTYITKLDKPVDLTNIDMSQYQLTDNLKILPISQDNNIKDKFAQINYERTEKTITTRNIDDYLLERDQEELLFNPIEPKFKNVNDYFTKPEIPQTKSISYEELMKQRVNDEQNYTNYIKFEHQIITDEIDELLKKTDTFIENPNITKLIQQYSQL